MLSESVKSCVTMRVTMSVAIKSRTVVSTKRTSIGGLDVVEQLVWWRDKTGRKSLAFRK
jgi:hypothetical protein